MELLFTILFSWLVGFLCTRDWGHHKTKYEPPTEEEKKQFMESYLKQIKKNLDWVNESRKSVGKSEL